MMNDFIKPSNMSNEHDIDILEAKILECKKVFFQKNIILRKLTSFDKMIICKDFKLQDENHDFWLTLQDADNMLTVADLKECLLLLK